MWRARPGTHRPRWCEGGFRVSQFNIERILKAFLPDAIPEDFAELKIPLKVTATDFFGHSVAVLSRAATSIRRLPLPPPSPRCSGR